jgi:hypothetical protein
LFNQFDILDGNIGRDLSAIEQWLDENRTHEERSGWSSQGRWVLLGYEAKLKDKAQTSLRTPNFFGVRGACHRFVHVGARHASPYEKEKPRPLAVVRRYVFVFKQRLSFACLNQWWLRAKAIG